MPRIIAATLTLCLALLFSACGDDDAASVTGASSSKPATTFPLTIDSCGKKVEISKRPAKVLAVGAAPVNLIAAAGAADRVVGVAGNQLPDASVSGVDAPVLTRDEPSTEEIIGSGADLVISYGLFGANVKNLKQSGINSLVTQGNCDHGDSASVKHRITYETIYDDIETYGKLFGTEERAAASIVKLKQRVGATKAEIQDGSSMTAASLYFFGDKLSSNGGRRGIIHVNMEIVGLKNVFADVEKVFFKPTVEDLIDRNPDVIMLTYGYRPGQTFSKLKKQLLALPGIRDTKAVKNDRIVGYPAPQAEADPLAVDGIETIAKGVGRL